MVIITDCGDCREDVTLNIGSGHHGTVTVGDLVADIFYEGSVLDPNTFNLPMWDCPACGYADSYDRTYRA